MNPELLDQDNRLEIRLATDRDVQTLTISDKGIGMSPEEQVDNIGTIAKSETRELRSQANAGEEVARMIGQFGVGFYSSLWIRWF